MTHRPRNGFPAQRRSSSLATCYKFAAERERPERFGCRQARLWYGGRRLLVAALPTVPSNLRLPVT